MREDRADAVRGASLLDTTYVLAKESADAETGGEIGIAHEGVPEPRVGLDSRPVRRDLEWKAVYEEMVAMMEEGLPPGDLTLPSRDELYRW